MKIIYTNTTKTANEILSSSVKTRLKQLYQVWVDPYLVNGHGIDGSNFKPAEALARKILWASKFLPHSILSEHGLDNGEKEADIVVNKSVQIEVVTAMAKGYNLDEQILSFVAHEQCFTVPDAVYAKFSKTYTDKYRKELFILLAGDNVNTIELASSVLERINNDGRCHDNLFKTIYLARYDLVLDGYDLAIISDYDDGGARGLCRVIVPCDDTVLPLIKRKTVTFDEVKDESFYFADIDIDGVDYAPQLVVRGKEVMPTLKRYNILA